MVDQAATPVIPDESFESAVLVLDTGSPIPSLAVAAARRVLAVEAVETSRASGRLLTLVDRALRRSGLGPGDLTAAAGLRGPGSFTGLRVGLATLQGMRQALEIPVATLPSLQVLASLAAPAGSRVTACVDALREQWLTQVFIGGLPPRALGEPRLCSRDELLEERPLQLVGFGVARFREILDDDDDVALIEPGPLAAAAVPLLATDAADWSLEALISPLYLQPPARAGGPGRASPPR